MDVLTDVLASLRLTGGVVLEGAARGAWCVNAQIPPKVIEPFFSGKGQVIAYHYVKRGRVFAQMTDEEPVEAGPGSVIILPRNVQHRVFTKAVDDPVEVHEFIVGLTEHGLAKFEIPGQEADEKCDFYCGFLGVAGVDHPLLDTLPPIMVVNDAGTAKDAWLQSNLQFLTADVQDPAIVARIAELLFAQATRAYISEMPSGSTGWLAGLKDPVVARALGIIHSRFAEELELCDLAREVGVSRTVLGRRFADLLGESPMRYCLRWRMRVAANMLLEGRERTANIAYAVGFSSEAAFVRAFKREYGHPPATWRRGNAASN